MNTVVSSSRNCAIKSMRLLTRYILEMLLENKLFTFDPITLGHGGEGYQPHKELKQEIVNNATEKLIESVKIIEKYFPKVLEFFLRSTATSNILPYATVTNLA
jgi:hypothetical protein